METMDKVKAILEGILPFIGHKKTGRQGGPSEFRPESENCASQWLTVGEVFYTGDFGIGVVDHRIEDGMYMAEGRYIFLVHIPSGAVQQIMMYDPWAYGSKGYLTVCGFVHDGEEIVIPLRFSIRGEEDKEEQLRFSFQPSFINLDTAAKPWQPGKLSFVR